MITTILRLRSSIRRAPLALGIGVAMAVPTPDANAQWVTEHEQFYLQARHNWEFRDRYQGVDRLFNAFDYGHAILYETLWRSPNAPADELEVKEYDRLTKKILIKPPRVPLEEGAIEIAYARLAPEAKLMFEWAHILHRQIYDVWADEEIPVAEKDRHVGDLLAYYKSRPDLAFSSKPKSMELMQEQPYSLAFRERYPKFNGLIWAYHWLQVGLYEPLIVGQTVEQRQALVRATVARFWQMLDRPVETMPYQMPMTAAVAPTFAARYPEAAIIFDNLHSMHDVISDILANDAVPRDRKRAEILRAARLFRDDTSYVMPVAAWLTMSREMGVGNMGGPAVGFTPDLPRKTVTYGAVMQHDPRTGEMTGMKVGQMTGEHDMEGMAHGETPQPDSARAAADSVHPPDHAAAGHEVGGMDSATMSQMMALHMRMMSDSVIHRRIMADTALRRMMHEMMERMPADQRERMHRGMQDSSGTPPHAPPQRPRETRPESRPPDPHTGHRPPPPKPSSPFSSRT